MDEDLLLILRMRSGDEEAIDAFVTKYYAAILRYCQFHIPDSFEAEDLTQEVFVRFFRNLPQYRHYGKAANYLYAIAGNACRDWHRRERPASLEETPEPAVEPLAAADLRLDLRRALDNLPEEQREVAILCLLQGRTQREAAAILGISLPLVKYRLRQAKKQMRNDLKTEECK